MMTDSCDSRGDVLLRQRAKRLQKQNGEGEGKVAVLDQGKTKEDWKTQLKHSLSRPISESSVSELDECTEAGLVKCTCLRNRS